ncbi:MAG: cupin domain-containing protein [Candidatus Heimdallarchaeota archaeon]|nr:cupin domain-containing protein [Candidatus Heimdallarchaeota archaeon]
MKEDFSKYSISKEIKFKPLELLDFPSIITSCQKEWQNIGISKVNDCVIRLAVVQGEFHWHKHDKEDEFFYVISGLLFIDLEERVVELLPQQGFLVPKGVVHRTRAPERTAIMLVEGSTVEPTGDL